MISSFKKGDPESKEDAKRMLADWLAAEEASAIDPESRIRLALKQAALMQRRTCPAKT